MATKIKIKRSTSAVPSSLDAGELAYTSAGDVLYIGNTDNSGSVLAIGGKRNPGTLTANQALVANSTSGIDKIIVANAAIDKIWANGAAGTAGKILTSDASGNVYWGSSVVGTATDTQVLFNDNGALAGDAGLTYNKTSDTLSANTFLATSTVNASILQTSGFTANTTAVNLAASTKLYANGALGSANNVLRIDGSGIPYWSADAGDISSVTAGDGLTGGGSDGDLTIDVGAGNGISVNATAVAVLANNGLLANSLGLYVVAGNNQLISNSSGVWVDQSKIDHNSLANYDANKHVDHTAVTVTAGDGLTGGGNLDSSFTIDVGAGNGIAVNATSVAVLANDGIISNATGVYVKGGSTLTVNTTGVHVNSTLSITDLTLSGNLTINGTLTTVDTTNLAVNDSIIELARNNGADSLDIGFYGKYVESTTNKYTGLIWDTSADVYELFYNAQEAPTATVNTGATGYTRALLKSYLDTGALVANSTVVNITANASVSVALVANTLSLTTALPATSGGTGFNTTAVGDLLVGTTGNAFLKLAVNGSAGKVLQSDGTTVVYGDIDGGTFS